MRALLLLLPVMALVACDGASSDDTDGGDDVDGATVYSDTCAACHGADGTGTGAGPSLVDRAAGLSAADVENIVRNGTGTMAGFSTDQVSDAEAAAVAEYVVGEWGGE